MQTGLFAQKKGQALIDSILNGLPALHEDSNKVKALARIAEVYLQTDPAKGIPYAKNGLATAQQLPWKKGVARLQNLMGLLIGDTGNNTEARVHFLQSFALHKELGASFSMISNLNNIGRSYQRESDFPRALEYYFKAMAIAEEIKSNEQMALVGTNITASFITQKNYARALEYAQMTLRNAELSHTPNNAGKALLHLGVIKMETKDSVTARGYMERAVKIYEEMGNRPAIAQVLSTMAPLEYPDYKKAIGLMTEAQKILDEIGPSSISSVGNMQNLGTAWYDLAMYGAPADKQKMLEKAESYLQRGIQLAKETANAEYEANLRLALSDVEKEKGDYKLALENFRNFYTINDSLYSQNKKNELAGLESKHKLDLKDKEIAINKLKLVSQQRAQLGLIAGLVLLGIIGGLLFRQSRMRKRSNTALIALNDQLDRANKIKARFFGILSHDLRSPVASLANYLFLLKNEPVAMSIEEQAAHQQQIGQSTEALLETMETMLLWSKEQMDNYEPEIKMVPVAELFDYLQKFFLPSQQLNIRFDDPGPLELSADENYLKVIMQNLTSNAIRALENRPDGLIIWKAAEEGGQTVLSLTDNGPGIDAEQAGALYHENAGFNRRTGFGFHLIRDLARAIRLQITIRSAPGAGTTFVLSS